MIHVFGALSGLWKSKRIYTDHWVFRLHYRFTVLVLLMFCIVVSTKQYGGEPIKCSKDMEESKEIIENYCFVTSTYTVRSAMNLTTKQSPHPGISMSHDGDDFRYHTYYQWVGFMLFIQAIFFYIPHWMWKNFEGGRLESMLERDPNFLAREEKKRIRDIIAENMRARWTKDKFFVVKYMFCEILCLVNLFSQMMFLNKVFENEFLGMGVEVVRYYQGGSGMVSPLVRMFPRVTSCTYRYFGHSGKVNSESVLCVLAVNAVNEKIFLFLWFWFVVLAVLTVVVLVFKGFVFSLSSLRLYFLCNRFPFIPPEHFKVIVETGNLSNYLFVNLLGQNMDDVNFLQVIEYFVTIQRGKIN